MPVHSRATSTSSSPHGFEAVEPAHDGVVLAEVAHVLEVHHVVDTGEFEPRVVHNRPERTPADPAEAVEADTHDLALVDRLTGIQI